MKRFTWLGIFIVLSLVLAACGTSEELTPTPEPEAAPTEVSASEAEDEMMKEADDEMIASETIVDVAVADGRFTTLVAALEAAGLVDTLSSEGEFTVFAPVDEAFAALPEGTVESLLADPEGALTDVLLYHVVEGAVPAEDVVNLSAAQTISGQEIAVAVDGDGQVVLNGTVKVIITDIEASNGVIHVIDAVLIPAA